MPDTARAWSMPELAAMIENTWGFRSLRPLQERAIAAVLDERDSLVVLPTGGGKSLCYQAPAVLRGGTTVVISPLISLMKDQVDGLQACGVAAAQFNSSQTIAERNAVETDLLRGELRLLFVSPERLMSDNCQWLLRQAGVKTFAIDEAHCISHWGHDFRPEYRQFRSLRERFPGATIHGYTATATERVRHDIVQQLGLSDPEVLIGDFDRPNLTYRVLQRRKLLDQVLEVLARHPNEAGIIYCIRRRDVDELCAMLRGSGHSPLSYHAGLTAEERHAAQDAFLNEKCNLVVATVAFGMGIDRSNIRFVLHAGMPKSIEHYQQEAGRAGRDGLPAECVLLHSPLDFMTWKTIIEKSAEEAGADPEFVRSALAHLEEINRYCRGITCRHRVLVEHFGQPFEPATCKACDVCLGEVSTEPEASVIAQKILSCVARVKEGYGIGHVMAVLQGETNERVQRLGHDKLSTFGLLRDTSRRQLRDWLHQLIGQNLLEQTGDEYPILKLNAASWEVMKSQRPVVLSRYVRQTKKVRERRMVPQSEWQGVDTELFAALRRLRKQIADEIQKPPYLVFNDATLREMARTKPTTRDRLLMVTGVGEAKLRTFGERFLEVIRATTD
jgi:ATP-dependent DNA helicase RecQ